MMIKIPTYVQFVLDTLAASGFAAYIVGGSVRDALRQKTPDDFDVTTNAEPNEICAVFEGKCKVILTGIQHGTVTVLSEGKPIEVTTFRTDGNYADNRHPEKVTFVKSIDADLARRDFTVNAMAYTPNGGLVDLYGGTQDLQNRILRCVGNPDIRFHEDALRMLRALRFAAVLQFEIEAETAKAIHENRTLLNNVSAERIRTELFKLLTGADAEKILLAYRDVFFTLFPQLADAYTHENYEDAVRNVSALEKDAVLRFAALLSPVAPLCPAACFSVIDSLKTDKKSADALKFSIQHANDALPATSTETKHALNQHGAEHLTFWAKLKKDANALSAIETVLQSGEAYRISDLAVSGDDIAVLGYKGKQIGEVLNRLLTQVIEGKLANNKETLLNAIKK